MFQNVNQANAGDNVGLSLRGFGQGDIERGMVVGKPGAYTAHTTFKAEVSL